MYTVGMYHQSTGLFVTSATMPSPTTWCVASRQSRMLSLGWWRALGDAIASRHFSGSYTGFLQFRSAVATLVHLALYGHASSYLTDECCLVIDARPRRLRSLRLVHFSSVRRPPTSATEPSVQLDLESGTICRQTSDLLYNSLGQ